MFEEEREEYARFFDFFKTMFKEDVGFIPSIYEDDDFEIDLIIGEDSGEIRGIRVLQMASSDEEEEDLEWEGSAKEVLESPEEEADEDEIEEDEDEEEDEEEDICEMYQYDFVATDFDPSKIVGNLCLETTFDMPNHEEDEEEDDETEEEEDQCIESKESESQVEEHNGEWYHLRLYGVKGETDETEIDITCALLENGDHPEKKYLFLPHPQLD